MNPALPKKDWHYVYLLKSNKASYIYIGCTSDLKKRLNEHEEGKVYSTKKILPEYWRRQGSMEKKIKKISDAAMSGPAASVWGKSLGKEMPRHLPHAARTCQPKVFLKTFG